MKSDEFSGKMLDDHIEVFCYCNFDYYRNLFWCFCISIYEKENFCIYAGGVQPKIVYGVHSSTENLLIN